MSAAQWHENNNEACRSDATPTQVTEAHRELARRIMLEFTQAGTATASDVRMAAQLIADSEAKATAQLRADRDYNRECINRLASATGTLGEKSERVVEGALSTIDQLRAEVERLRDGGVQRIKDAMAVVMDERDSFKARAERAEDELATERAKVRLLHSALQNLADEQNGAPLERRREEWQEALVHCAYEASRLPGEDGLTQMRAALTAIGVLPRTRKGGAK